MVVRSLDGLLAPMSFMLRSTYEKGLRIPEGSENQILLAARVVRDHYFPNRSRNFPDWILVFAILEILEARPDATVEDIFQMMTTPAIVESCDLRRGIHMAIAECRSHKAEHGWDEPSVFNGARRTEFEKLSAMTAYLSERDSKLCRQKLGKLLFYADFAALLPAPGFNFRCQIRKAGPGTLAGILQIARLTRWYLKGSSA